MEQTYSIESLKNLKTSKIPIDKILLDRDNPRIQFLIDTEITKGKKRSDIAESKLKLGLKVKTRNNFTALKESIETTGLLEPIWVYETGEGYIVVEGNTRKLVFDELHEKYPHSTDWVTIDAKVIPSNANEDLITFIRLESHLGGKQPWDAYERASYLYTLKQKGYTLPRLARESRSNLNEIKEDIKAFEIMRDHFLPKYGGTVENPVSKYSYFVEWVGNSGISQLERQGKISIEEYCNWLAEEKIPRAIDVRDLPQIFSDDNTAEVFKNEGYYSAMQLLSSIKPDLTTPLFKDIEKVIEGLRKLKYYEIELILTEETAKKDLIIKLIETSSKVIGTYGGK